VGMVPVEGPQPAAIIIPQAPCLFCGKIFRTDELNYMPIDGQCLQDFQQARAKVDRPVPGA